MAALSDSDGELFAPIPHDAPPVLTQWNGSKPTHSWTYTNETGCALFHVFRFDRADGGKGIVPQTLWRTPCGALKWRWKAYPVPRPLYRLHDLAARPDAPVLIVEGEKTAEAAALTFVNYVVTTSAGGCKAAASADWSPLQGREVAIWPDNDDAGLDYARDVARLALEVGAASVRTVSVPNDWPDGWDLADELPEGVTIETLREMLANAEPAVAGPNTDDDESRLIVLTAHEMLARQFAPRTFLMAPVLPVQGTAMLYAKRGIGKTWAALSFGYAVASGGTLWRWRADTPRRVLHVCGEMPGAVLKERLASIVAASNGEPPAPDFFRLLSADVQERPLPDFASDEGQELLNAHLGEAELIILDNVSTLFRSGKENEAESWGSVQDWLLSKRREGRSVLLVHHAGKTGGQRGTSRREDVLDTVIALKSPDDFDPTQGARFEVHLEKARGIAGTEVEPFEAQLEIRDGAAVWTWRALEDAKASAIASLREGGLTTRKIAKELGMSPSAVDRVIQKLKARSAA